MIKAFDCIAACLSCATACETCASSCLQEDDVQMMSGCIAQDRDCADLCRLAAALMARNSPRAADICKLCAEACKACAEECAKHAHDHCQACAKACSECAQACMAMAA
ncbi:four-helix bundle copper-binding protein (plasmid) [Pseudomonas iridis]